MKSDFLVQLFQHPHTSENLLSSLVDLNTRNLFMKSLTSFSFTVSCPSSSQNVLIHLEVGVGAQLSVEDQSKKVINSLSLSFYLSPDCLIQQQTFTHRLLQLPFVTDIPVESLIVTQSPMIVLAPAGLRPACFFCLSIQTWLL